MAYKRMKKITTIILIAILLISGCQSDEGSFEASDSSANETIAGNTVDAGTSETSVVTQTPASEVTAETSFSCSYDFVPIDLDYDFEEIMDICNDYTGTDISSYSGDVINTIDVNGHHILYIPDYGEHLNYLIEISPEGAADDLPECDYHILRAMAVDGVYIFEFDDTYWAGVSYGRFVENAVSSNMETIDSSYSDGYCFACDTTLNHRRYTVRYYFGSFIMAYDYTVDTVHSHEYDKYIDLCNALGLPTSDQISGIVLHN